MDILTPQPNFTPVSYMTEDFNGMPYRWVGRSGLRGSVIGAGLWKIGYPDTGDGARADEKTGFRILDRAIELGVTFWDTANRYNEGSGNSERVIGRWLKANPDQRSNVVVCTKCFGGVDGVTPNHSRLSRQNILNSLYASLARMQQDYVDVLYFHRYDPVIPVEESLAAIEDLVRRDLVRYFAVSNFSVDQLRLYQAMEREFSVRTRVIAVQNRFDIVRGEAADRVGVLEFCAEQGIALVPYSPLAQGLLTNRYLDITKVGPGDRLVDEGTLGKIAVAAVVERQQSLAALAQSWGLDLSQLALAYMMTLPGMGPLIPGVTSVAQLEGNAQAGALKLSDEQKSQIRDITGI